MADQTTYYRFPDLSADEQYIRTFQDRYFNRYAAYRNSHMQRITIALYYLLGEQWIELDEGAMLEGMRGFVFKDMLPELDLSLPRPVTNMIAPAIDVEFATLSKRQWVPKIPTYSRDPRTAAANKVAQDVLRDRLDKLHWEDIRDSFILNMISMGTSTLYSFWDESYFDVVSQASPNLVRCMGCGATYSSPEIPISFHSVLSQGGFPSVNDLPEEGDMAPMEGCPKCGGLLDETAMDDDEAVKSSDPFGRPLGKRIPRGQTALELVTPYEYYPQNGGLNVTTETVRQHGICKVRSLDWIEEHYPDIIDQVAPEDPTELMRDHPLVGEWNIVGRFNHALDSGIYDHHARVFDLIALPSYRFPQGRYITVIGSTQKLIARNEALLRDATDEKGEKISVPTALVATAIWKPRQGEFWGKTLADDIISPQNRLNGIDAQVIEARERMGSPNLLIPGDAALEGPSFRTGYGLGKVFFWQPSPIAPTAKPEIFGGQSMPSGTYNERAACEQSITKIIGPADIEMGEAPRNITTTSGLQILGEQAERRRATRERGVTSAFQRVWEHQLQLLWVLRTDVDSYEAELPDGSWEIQQFKGQMIEGQTKVKIERQAYIDRSIIVRESTMQALQAQLYDISTPLARKKLLELMDLPTDVNEDSNLQIEHARRQWVDFVDKGKIPVIDVSLDNPFIRSEVLGQFLMMDEGLNLAEKCLWPDILPIIAGWEQEYQALSMQDQMARQFYGGIEPPPKQAAEMYAKAEIEFQKTTAALKANPVAMNGNPMTGQPPMPMPQPPPPPQFLPQQPEQRVYLVWQNIIQRKGGLEKQIVEKAVEQMAQPADLAKQVDQFLRFRAVYEAYRMGAGASAPAPGSQPVGAPPKQIGPGEQAQGPAPTPGPPPPPPMPAGA